MKVVENSPQNARNCTIIKNFLGGACPQTPLTKARSFAARDMPLRGMYTQNFKVGPPPLRNPAYAPALTCNYSNACQARQASMWQYFDKLICDIFL